MVRLDRLRKDLYGMHQTVLRDPNDPHSPFLYTWLNREGHVFLWVICERGVYRFLGGCLAYAFYGVPPRELIPCYATRSFAVPSAK